MLLTIIDNPIFLSNNADDDGNLAMANTNNIHPMGRRFGIKEVIVVVSNTPLVNQYYVYLAGSISIDAIL